MSGGAGEDNCIKCSQKRTASSCHALPPLMTHSRNGPQVHHLMPARRLRGRLGCGFQVCASNPGLRCALSPPSFAVSLDAVPKGERLRISFRSFAPRAAATQPRQHFRPHFGGQAARAPGLNVPGETHWQGRQRGIRRYALSSGLIYSWCKLSGKGEANLLKLLEVLQASGLAIMRWSCAASPERIISRSLPVTACRRRHFAPRVNQTPFKCQPTPIVARGVRPADHASSRKWHDRSASGHQRLDAWNSKLAESRSGFPMKDNLLYFFQSFVIWISYFGAFSASSVPGNGTIM